MPSRATLSKIGKALDTRIADLLDFQRGRTTKEREIESLVLKLKRRTPSEVSLVSKLAAAVFQHHDLRSVS